MVELPLWLLVLILLFAAVTALSHFLLPSVRWFFRKRMERVVARVNTRLVRPIEPFKLARRYDMIQRLIYDPDVTKGIVQYAEEHNVPENVAFENARTYAREIVPSFSATAYFAVGTRLAKLLSRSFYQVRLGDFDRQRLRDIDPDATVIFVINHRSNMDYVLVTHLVSQASTLSYAVGEWARVWPLSSIIKMMGAYFIRRKSRGQLYRRVLARYVQMATANGVTQVIFPEGRLSLDGRIGEPRMGLLNYIVSDFDTTERDVIFVPVAINYDHVIEDRTLLKALKAGNRRFGVPIRKAIWEVLRYFGQRLTRQSSLLGTASVCFAEPLSYREFAEGMIGDLTETVASELMARIQGATPALPVPLIATVLQKTPELTKPALAERIGALVANLTERGIPGPRRSPEEFLGETLQILSRRNLIVLKEDQVTVADGAEDLITYYANSIAHHFEKADAPESVVPEMAET